MTSADRPAEDAPESTSAWTPPDVDEVPEDRVAEMTSVLRLEAPETSAVQPPEPPEPAEPSEPSSDSRSGSDSVSGWGTASGSITGRRSSSRSRPSQRGSLGAGIVDVPPVPYRDPQSAVMRHPVVAENKRFCGNCGAKVGRTSDGEPGPTEGTCEQCGTLFSFTPRLSPGETIGGQYEVLGALAYGGLGWIYLAQDHAVADRWVVLKGLIDTGDETAIAAAVNETNFLAEVEHPNIVKIYNFVEHPDPKTGTTVGYIVMEYVGGQSLRQLVLAHHRDAGRAEGLPIGQVLAYGLEILPALGYLHGKGLLYCDLKPDNVIQTHDQLKLIDMGAVRRMDDYTSPMFFTSGYSAPDLATEGPSVQSDLFTVGRTLAVLSFEFAGYSTRYKTTLPPPEDVPLFSLFRSYYRLLKRATHSDPGRRFASAAEMADQLTGVLRETMALGTGTPQPGESTMFGTENRTFGVEAVVADADGPPVPDALEVIASLPVPLVDTHDPAASLLASMTATEPRGVIEALTRAPHDSIEVRLRVVRARVELGELAEANRQLQAAQYIAVKAGDPHDWRLDWYRALIELAGGRHKLAHAAFDAVYDELPGELAPKLGLAVTSEAMDDYMAAARYYEMVWRTDRTYVSAAFGLARVYLAQGARDGAVQVLESIPLSSTHHTAAQVAAIKTKTRIGTTSGQGGIAVAEHDLVDASERLERLTLDAERRALLAAEVLEAAYGWVQYSGGNRSGGGVQVLGCHLTEREVRFGLERCYRALARLSTSTEQRIALVDKANAIRPRTLT